MSATNTRPRPSLHADTGGAVYVEFLVAFIPFFILVLGMMQLALMYSAHLVVQHAAASAARAAIVVFPDCAQRYDGAPENVVNGGGRGDDPASALGSLFGAGSAPGGSGFGSGGGSSGGARLDAVRFAAGFPLVATSPSLDELTHDRDPRRQGIYDAIGGDTSPAARLALGALVYNNVAMAVTFPRAERETNYRDRWNSREELTTRVTYLFHCGVPIVSKMACDSAIQLYTNQPLEQIRAATAAVRNGRASIRDIQSHVEAVQAASARLNAAQPGLDELNHTGTGGTASAVLLGLTGGHYYVIRAEATLPVQGTARRITGACYNASRSR
jgi:hypothetical protein